MEFFHPDQYDQYSQFDKLPKLLKRIPFANKMQQCYDLSLRSIAFLELADKTAYNSNMALPWVVESLAMMCIEAKEISNCSVSPKLPRQFATMYNAIWDKSHKGVRQIKFFGPAYVQTQFCLQEKPLIKYFRYHYIFNFKNDEANIRDCFLEKFGTPYWSFLQFGLLLKASFRTKQSLNLPMLEWLITKKFIQVGKQLSITRDGYIAELQQMTNNSNDYFQYACCVRPSYKYAFIKENDDLYFPLPHLISINTTSALFYRLTERNKTIRNLIGKNVLENYLLKIIKESNVYDDVRGEMKYKIHGSEALSPDVMATVGNELLFLDSKASVPPKDLRLFDEDTYDKLVDRYADNIVQLYKQVLATPKYLNPFPNVAILSKDQIWGAVVVHEDARFLHHELYSKVSQKLSLADDSQEAAWIKEHLITIGLYDLERYCFCSLNAIDGIQTSFSQSCSCRFTSQSLLSFSKDLQTSLDGVAKEAFKTWGTI